MKEFGPPVTTTLLTVGWLLYAAFEAVNVGL